MSEMTLAGPWVLLGCATACVLFTGWVLRTGAAPNIASGQLEELQRWRTTWVEYHRWLVDHPDVMLVLENMAAEVRGDVRDLSHPPSPNGPWDVHGLRHWLRLRAMRRG